MVTLSDLTDFLEHFVLCSPTFHKPFDARFNGIYLMKRLAAATIDAITRVQPL